MKRLTKRYSNGFITLDASLLPQTQETIDCEIRNHDFIKAAVEKLYEYEERNPNSEAKPDSFTGLKEVVLRCLAGK